MVKYNIESFARARGPMPMTSVSSLADVLCWLLLSSSLTSGLPEDASDD